MNLLNIRYMRLFASFLILAIISCSNPWDDRESIDDSNLSINLNEAITSRAETSQFGELLVQTGYDKILASSKTYTVFAPTNTAMSQVGSEILNDPDLLKQFVGNHIALTSYSSVRNEEQTQIKMYSNKYLLFKGNTLIDDATIVTADHYAANGVFHIINKPLTPKLNIWEYINSRAGSSAMIDYLLSLKELNIYPADSTAKVLSIERGAGYQSDSLTNSYLRNVYNLNNEKNSYTLFLMEDAGYNSEVDKMKPYLIKPSNRADRDSTAIYSKYFTLRDLAFAKKYEINELPATLTSRFGVEFEVDKTQIVGEPIHLSNGIVYIMKKVEVKLDKRLLTTKIEGESYNRNFNAPRNKIFVRDKKDPFDVLYNDVMVLDPGFAQPILVYEGKSKDLYSTTYQVYWRAINDRPATFQQTVWIGGVIESTATTNTFTGYKAFPYKVVDLNVYTDVYIGDYTPTQAGDVNLISLVGFTLNTNGNNSLTLDYLKLVPKVK
jgi:uncharacterized surface protein with fasciclin (FAS1) repeats